MIEVNNFQRAGAQSNTVAGREFEDAAHIFFEASGIKLTRGYVAQVGYSVKKGKKFDLDLANWLPWADEFFAPPEHSLYIVAGPLSEPEKVRLRNRLKRRGIVSAL